jgi:ribosome-associated protein
MVGEDLRGTKAVLVSRLRDALKSASAAAKVVDTAASLGEGVVSRKDLHRAARLAAGLPRPTGEAELRQAQEAALETAAAFSSVFRSPHDVARVLIDAHGEDIAIMDVRGRCSFTDHMVVASARSTQHARAMAAAVLHEVKTRCKEVAPGVAPVIEGAEDPDQHWLVVDAGSVVVHVFQEDVRKEYDLEGLWGEGTEIARVAPLQKKYTLNSITA